MGLAKLVNALLEEAVALVSVDFSGLHAVPQLPDGLLLESGAVFPKEFEVEQRFFVLLNPQLVIVDEQSTTHDHADANVNGFCVGYRLAGEMSIFNAVGDLADETLDAIVRMPFRFHAVLVGLPVILDRIAVEREESLEHVSKRDVGVAGAGLLELFGVEWQYEG